MPRRRRLDPLETRLERTRLESGRNPAGIRRESTGPLEPLAGPKRAGIAAKIPNRTKTSHRGLAHGHASRWISIRRLSSVTRTRKWPLSPL